MLSLKTLLCGTVLAGALAGLPLVASADPVEMKLADRLPAEHFIVKNGLDPWIAAMSGELTIQTYHGGQLGKGSESLNMLKSGLAQIVEMSPGLIGQEMQLSSVTELPLASTACQGQLAYAALQAPGGTLDKAESTPNGTTLLISMTVAPYYIFSTKELSGPADLEGLKIATQGPTLDKVMGALGAIPTRVAASEIYDAITRGTVDAVVFPPLSVLNYDIGSRIKTVMGGTSFGQSALGYFINRADLEALPAETQAKMLDAGKSAAMNLCTYMQDQEKAALEKLQSQGAAILILEGADAAAVQEKLASVGAAWAADMDAKGQPGSAVLAEYKAALDAAAVK